MPAARRPRPTAPEVGGDQGPNLFTQQRTALRLASTPLWARSSSTSRTLSVVKSRSTLTPCQKHARRWKLEEKWPFTGVTIGHDFTLSYPLPSPSPAIPPRASLAIAWDPGGNGRDRVSGDRANGAERIRSRPNWGRYRKLFLGFLTLGPCVRIAPGKLRLHGVTGRSRRAALKYPFKCPLSSTIMLK
jgi:hypothetical protein